MNFLLIGGQPNTGKSETIARLFLLISTRYKVISNVHPHTALPPTTPLEDFSAILHGVDATGKQVKILIHSPTDDIPNINLLKENVLTHKPDIIITSIRDIKWERTEVEKIVGSSFSFEIPLARITRRHHHRGKSKLWYQSNIDNIVKLVIESPPFNLM